MESNNRTFQISYDDTRGIFRIEVFQDKQCIASRVAYTLNELKTIGSDFAPLEVSGLEKAIELISEIANGEA